MQQGEDMVPQYLALAWNLLPICSLSCAEGSHMGIHFWPEAVLYRGLLLKSFTFKYRAHLHLCTDHSGFSPCLAGV